MTKLTQSQLKELLHYDVNTGVFTWIRSSKGTKAGAIAGCFIKDGYRSIRVNRKIYREHYLAWLYVYGSLPNMEVVEFDHKDGNPANNAIDNLRLASKSQNACNTKVRKSSVTGFKGVERSGTKFQARIRFEGIRYCLGCYATPEEAHAARNAKAKELHGEFFKAG